MAWCRFRPTRRQLYLVFVSLILLFFLAHFYQQVTIIRPRHTYEEFISYTSKPPPEKNDEEVADEEEEEPSFKCSPWPNLELFLPIAPTSETVTELQELFLPSYTLFWPVNQSNTSLLLIADEEAKHFPQVEAMKKMVDDDLNIPNHLHRIAYNEMPLSFRVTNMKGHDRQQWLMFWADNFTTADYVGFVDTDTVFISRVALPDIFDAETQRPVVRPLYGEPHRAGWYGVPVSTLQNIGRNSPFFCMTYFPVIIKVAHLAPMREHIRLTTNKAFFDESFREMSLTSYSQFDVMCAYLWYFKRDEYIWAIGQRDPYWTGPVPPGQVLNKKEAGITRGQLNSHGPRVAMHWGVERRELLITFKKGVCLGMLENDTNRPTDCPKYLDHSGRLSQINIREWHFEGYTLTNKNESWALYAHQRRLASNDKCPHEWNLDRIHQIEDNLIATPTAVQTTVPIGVVYNHLVIAAAKDHDNDTINTTIAAPSVTTT